MSLSCGELSMDLDLDLNHRPQKPPRGDFGIGAVGDGCLMPVGQLKADSAAGYNLAGITSRTPEIAREVADLHGISRVYDTIGEMLRDPSIEILDIAVPPDQQLPLIREAVRCGRHLKG